MDVDVPRYPDGYRRPYSPPPPPPPSAGERRAPSTYPASPRTAAEPPYDERRYPSGSREWYPPYDRRSRDWNQAEEDAYWKLRVYPPPAPAERERYERDAAQPSTRAWEPRTERDPREQPSSYPPPVPPADERYPIASREIDRTRPTAPPAYAGRVRAHSPSPIRRTAMDDPRPPLKRPREDYPPAEYSYPPSRDVRREYPRPGSPVGYYERPPPPPPGAGAEREYPAARERAAYPPPPPPAQSASYERPRSPGRAPASYSRAAYSRPPDLREREYMPPSTRPA
ncbi:hypothetical protein BDQ17DRAFT_1427135 [Cyathus striatus]|nr:hypothetical protein BDQ17DRAFT_1427135 [Cyathus striatus]